VKFGFDQKAKLLILCFKRQLDMTTPHVGRYGSANRNQNGNLQQILSSFSLDDKLWQNKLLGKRKTIRTVPIRTFAIPLKISTT
jgi:hypothetical protein